ncbi:MAG: hypothetical protein ABJE95_29930 [Byssovorax sp.]
MARARAWILNFDAEDELSRGVGHTSSRAVLARFAALAARVGPLLAPGDVVVDRASPAALPLAAFVGRAWCPTPGALRGLARAGAVVPDAPPLAVLRRVNHRRFCADLGQALPGARYVDTLDDVVAIVNTRSPSGAWLLKRPFGFAGRARRRVRAGAVEPADRAWIEASIAAREGLQIEPWIDLDLDAGLHGFLAASGALTLGAPTVQRTDRAGAWLASARAAPGDLAAGEERSLFEATETTAKALADAGYFGPFGVDAFRWIDEGGARHWNPRGEINARYSMGWAVGMGEDRPDLQE